MDMIGAQGLHDSNGRKIKYKNILTFYERYYIIITDS